MLITASKWHLLLEFPPNCQPFGQEAMIVEFSGTFATINADVFIAPATIRKQFDLQNPAQAQAVNEYVELKSKYLSVQEGNGNG